MNFAWNHPGLLPSAFWIAGAFIAFLISVGFGLQIWNMRNYQIQHKITPSDADRRRLIRYILCYVGFGLVGLLCALYATVVLVLENN